MKAIMIALAGAGLFISGCSRAQNSTEDSSNHESAEVVHIEGEKDSAKWNKLTKEEEHVIVFKGTEYPGTGLYVDNHEEGTYQCKRCNTPLFDSESKFDSGTGWPSFDEYIGEAVAIHTDADGYRQEIVCGNCEGHLGHVFYGEGFTSKNTRHCVNSISLNFVPENGE